MTITKSLTHQQTPDKVLYNSYVTATSLDTTDPINGLAVDISGLAVRAISATMVASKGTSGNIVNLILQGSQDGTNFYTLKDTAAAAISSGATTITAATAATPIIAHVGTDEKSRRYFSSKYIRAQLDQGGSAGFTGTISLAIALDNAHRVN